MISALGCRVTVTVRVRLKATLLLRRVIRVRVRVVARIEAATLSWLVI